MDQNPRHFDSGKLGRLPGVEGGRADEAEIYLAYCRYKHLRAVRLAAQRRKAGQHSQAVALLDVAASWRRRMASAKYNAAHHAQTRKVFWATRQKDSW
jgi:hypothetical protein